MTHSSGKAAIAAAAIILCCTGLTVGGRSSASAAPVPAAAPAPKAAPASKTGRDLLDDLFRTPPEKFSPPKSTAKTKSDASPSGLSAAGGRTDPRDNPQQPGQQGVIADGSILIERPVLVVRAEGAVQLVADGRMIPVLPGRLLTELTASLERQEQSFFIVTSLITQYRGRNYALLRRVRALLNEEISVGLSEDIDSIVTEAERRLGVEGVTRPLGRLRRLNVTTKAELAARTAGPPTAAFTDNEKKGAQRDVTGQLAAGERNPEGFFENDPTRARLVPTRPATAIGAASVFQAAPPAPGPGDLLGKGLPPLIGRGEVKEEGSLLMGRTGRMVPQSGGVLLYFDSGEPPIMLLPCGLLEQADLLTDFGRRRMKLRVTGELTLYEGSNHLLLSRVVREPYDINDAK